LQGYIKDHRKELHSDVWMMPPLYHRTWQYLKYIVNHKDNTIPMRDGTFMTIKAGQHLTSLRDIAKNVGWYEGVKWKEPNPKTVTTILEWLENQSMIKIERGKGNRQYTLITLLNWDLYQQSLVDGNSQETASKQSTDINKNDKECFKNDKGTTTTTENPIQLFEKVLCRLSINQMEALHKWVDDFDGQTDIVNEAIRIADDKNRKYFGFVEYLLKEWSNSKLDSLDRVRAYEQEKFNKYQKSRAGKTTVRKEEIPDWLKKQKEQEDVSKNDEVNPDQVDVDAERAKLEEELKKFKSG
jgi:DnaD/phage-associated family protein